MPTGVMSREKPFASKTYSDTDYTNSLLRFSSYYLH